MQFTKMIQSLNYYVSIKSLLIFILVLTMGPIAPARSFAATYYVDQQHPQASDSNQGTQTLPWKTIQKAGAIMVAGDTVLVKQGTYDASTDCSWTTPSIRPLNSGTPGNQIAFRAFPGHQVFLDNRNLNGCPAIGAKRQDYITIDGFIINTTGNMAVKLEGAEGAAPRMTGIIVENMVIRGVRGPACDNASAFSLHQVSNSIIRNNRISDIHSTPKGCDGNGVQLYNTDHTIFEFNDIDDVGVGLYEKSNGEGNIWRYNYVRRAIRSGIRIDAHNGNPILDDQVYGNIVSNSSTGININSDSGSSNINPVVYNNTVVNCNRGILVGSNNTNTQVWNNIIYASNVEAGLTSSNPSLGFCDFNLIFLSPTICGSNNVTANPQFISTSFQNPDDFKLQALSPAKAAGRNGEDLGAYATGNERIGVNGGSNNATIPAAPTNFTVL